MDDEQGPNLDEILKNIRKAEVVTIFFPSLRQTLLVDGRHDAEEGPLVRVVPMVASADERFKSLRKLRPRFPRPESIVLIPWPKQVDSLERLGLLQELMKRFESAGFPDVAADCRKAYEELLGAERSEKVAAITGEGYHTLWERRA